jgi:hypothetical protein
MYLSRHVGCLASQGRTLILLLRYVLCHDSEALV